MFAKNGDWTGAFFDTTEVEVSGFSGLKASVSGTRTTGSLAVGRNIDAEASECGRLLVFVVRPVCVLAESDAHETTVAAARLGVSV